MKEVLKCKKHPKYMAKRKPTANCQDCVTMWTEKQNKELLVALIYTLMRDYVHSGDFHSLISELESLKEQEITFSNKHLEADARELLENLLL